MVPGQVKICVAEFLAALITVETFATNCAGKFTYLELDQWFFFVTLPFFGYTFENMLYFFGQV